MIHGWYSVLLAIPPQKGGTDMTNLDAKRHLAHLLDRGPSGL